MRHLFFALLLLGSAPAFADSIDKVRGQVVNSLAVGGTIDIDAEGKVVGYGIAHPEAYTQGVRDLLARDIPHWTFVPVLKDGVPRPVHAGMYLRLQAKPLGGDRFKVEIASAAFGYDETSGEAGAGTASAGSTGAPAPAARAPSKPVARPPRYPNAANKARVGATVVVALIVNGKGRVEEPVVEQTNLRVVADEKTMDQWRSMFEQETLAAVKHWSFAPPAVAGAYRAVRVPVVFIPAGNEAMFAPGRWDSYVPGPRHRIPWLAEDKGKSQAGIDALPAGGVFPLQQDVQLLTHLGDG